MTLLINPYRFASAGSGDYATEVLADSPEGYWRLDESSGNVIDLGSLARDMTVTGTPTRSVTGAVSTGTAYTFAGSQYATGAQDTAYGATDGPFGINTHSVVAEMWVKWTATTMMCPFSFRGPNSAEEKLVVLVNRTTAGDIVIYNDGADRARAVGPYNDGAWHHVVARFEAAATEGAVVTRLFVDGVAVASSGGGWPNVPASGYRPVIAANGSAQTFVGSIDEVAVYPTLSDARIAVHYAAA